MGDEIEKLLGGAVVSLWPDLPRDLQEAIFEAAAPQDEKMRETLAIYLHEHHARTAHKTGEFVAKKTAVIFTKDQMLGAAKYGADEALRIAGRAASVAPRPA